MFQLPTPQLPIIEIVGCTPATPGVAEGAVCATCDGDGDLDDEAGSAVTCSDCDGAGGSDPEAVALARRFSAAYRSALLAIFALALLLPGCAGTAPSPSSSGGVSPDPVAAVDAGLGLASLGASIGQTAALAAADGAGCLAMAVAAGGIDLARGVLRGVAGAGEGPVVLSVDAGACLPFGLPAAPEPDPAVDARVRTVLAVAGGAVAIASSAAPPDVAQVLGRVAVALDLAAGAYAGTVEALAAEAQAPDGRVDVVLAEAWSADLAVPGR